MGSLSVKEDYQKTYLSILDTMREERKKSCGIQDIFTGDSQGRVVSQNHQVVGMHLEDEYLNNYPSLPAIQGLPKSDFILLFTAILYECG